MGASGTAIMRNLLAVVSITLLGSVKAQSYSNDSAPAAQYNYGPSPSCTATITAYSTKWEVKTVTVTEPKDYPITSTVTTCPQGYPTSKTVTSTITSFRNCIPVSTYQLCPSSLWLIFNSPSRQDMGILRRRYAVQ